MKSDLLEHASENLDSTQIGTLQDWYRALSIEERSCPQSTQSKSRAAGSQDWQQSVAAFEDNSLFDERLQTAGIGKEELFAVLRAGTIQPKSVAATHWIDWLIDAFRAGNDADFVESVLAACPDDVEIQFLHVVGPLLKKAREEFRAAVELLLGEHEDAPFEVDRVELAFFVGWCEELRHILAKTLVLEMNVARLSDSLTGDTPAERFSSFITSLQSPAQSLSLLREHPVLARQVVVHLNKQVRYGVEFLGHLCRDWQTLKDELHREGDPGKLVAIEGQAGDKHRDGRSVLIARFQSGWQVVYKPRAMAIDVHFQHLLRWLGDRCTLPPFRTLNVIDRGVYGWVEFVHAQESKSIDEVKRFYLRQGGYLALLYGLGATDFHFENIVAAGEHPVLLDLESLFHPPRKATVLEGADKAVVETIVSSVLGVGLLPQKLWLNEAVQGLDVSGLGASESQMSPDELPVWESTGTDEMRLTRRRLPFIGGGHRAILNGRPVGADDYAEQIVAGFREVYETLVRHREELISEEGPLTNFQDIEVRTILRHTRLYGALLYESFHPDLMRDAIERDQHFDNLWNVVTDDPRMKRVVCDERRDLENGDIPFFSTRLGSRHLWSSNGHCIDNYFDEDEVASFAGRIPQLSDDDLARQLWFVRGSLATLKRGESHRSDRSRGLKSGDAPASRSKLLEEAVRVGDRLCQLAIQSGNEANWIGLTLANTDWSLKPSGLDFYSGLPGIAFFLGQLGHIAGERKYTDLARATTNTMRRQIALADTHIAELGAFVGWGGVLHSLTTLGGLWQESELIAEAKKIVRFLPQHIANDESHDIIAGSAGCLVTLLNLYDATGFEQALDAARQCGDRLLSQAITQQRGIGWTANAGHRALTGFSHGAAGIGWALLNLAVAVNDDRYRTAATEALAFERHVFCEKEQVWPDHRIDEIHENTEMTTGGSRDDESVFLTTWCNGAPGIGMGRADMSDLLDDPMLVEEIRIALKETMENGFGASHCMCHGDFGNLEFLLKAADVLDDTSIRDRVYEIAGSCCEDIRLNGWKCGVPMRVETPGIMAGLAGIGYSQLRLAEPERVPSLLLLEGTV